MATHLTNGHDNISALAYDNWLRRQNGNEVQDWLEAEAKIRKLHNGHAQPLNLELSFTKTRALTDERQAELQQKTERSVTGLLEGSVEIIDAAPQILQSICEDFGWDMGVVWLLDQDIQELRFATLWHTKMIELGDYERVCRRTTFPIGLGFPGRIWASQSAAWVHDVTHDFNEERMSLVNLPELHGAVGFPIWNGAEFLGVMEFFSRYALEPDEEILKQMLCISRQVTECNNGKNSLLLQQAEHRVAQKMQQRLLPKRMPTWKGFKISGRSIPARAVGGDCFDFFPLGMVEGESLGVVVADASGHGIGAALVVSEAHAYLRALTLACTEISTLLALTNRRLTDDRDANLFVTLLLVELDSHNRTLAYCGAGHCPGFVLDGSGRTKAILASDGLPLGIDSTSKFPSHRDIRLQPHDLIFLYTDGIVEAGVLREHLFGIERALDIIRTHQHETPDEILDALFGAARAFSKGPLHDDMTAVIIKVEDSPSVPRGELEGIHTE